MFPPYEMTMRFLLNLAVVVPMLIFAGCSAIEYNSTNSPLMVVVVERTPFYHNGPAQGNGPDLSLMKGDEVRLLRKEIGYSYVLLSDGQNGYVDNEALKPAPTEEATQKLKSETKPQKTDSPPEASNSTAPPSFRY